MHFDAKPDFNFRENVRSFFGYRQLHYNKKHLHSMKAIILASFCYLVMVSSNEKATMTPQNMCTRLLSPIAQSVTSSSTSVTSNSTVDKSVTQPSSLSRLANTMMSSEKILIVSTSSKGQLCFEVNQCPATAPRPPLTWSATCEITWHVVVGGHILVIGSQTPWIEAILLELGVPKIMTVDYTPILKPSDWNTYSQRAEWSVIKTTGFQYNGIVTYSSVEHSGLGRYGDNLNPWGDLIAMAKAYCLTHPGGKLLIGVPSGYDAVFFNMHRLYGPIQCSHLYTNWNAVYTEAKMF